MGINKIEYQLKENGDVLLYKDIFVVYMDLLKEHISNYNIDDSIVKLMDGDLINVNRAPLIIFKRSNSPQPPSVALLNQGLTVKSDKTFFSNRAMFYVYLDISCYGNTYLEAERLSSLTQEMLLSTSMQKIKAKSNDKFVGHEVLNWGATGLVSQDTKLFYNEISIRITMLFDTYSEI